MHSLAHSLGQSNAPHTSFCGCPPPPRQGTYIRSLAHDLAESLGTHAHLTALRRTRIGDFKVEDAWKIDDLVDAWFDQRRAIKAAREAEEEGEGQ